MTKIIIAGRSRSGKSTLAKTLSWARNLTVLKSCTNRPRRTPDEDDYHFFTPEEAAAIPAEDKLFPTLALDGFERWSSKKNLLEADIAILDFKGVAQAARLYQTYGYNVMVIYVSADPDKCREAAIQNAIKAGKSETEAIQEFERRNTTESPMFEAVEAELNAVNWADPVKSIFRPVSHKEPELFNSNWLRVWSNDFQFETLRDAVDSISEELSELETLEGGGYREFPCPEPLILEPEDWTESEWQTLCKLTGLIPEITERIQLDVPTVKCFINVKTRNNGIKG